jgi:hypothetical protein
MLMTKPSSMVLALLAAFGMSLGCSGGGGDPAAAEPGALGLVSPSPEGFANQAQPTLRWNPLEGAARYRVSLYADKQLRVQIESQDVDGTETRASAVLQDRAVIYARVEALDASGTPYAHHDSRFAVVVVPDDFPQFEIVRRDGRKLQAGYTLMNLQDPVPPQPEDRIAALVMVNSYGEIAWYLQRPRGYMTDARVLPNGHLLYLYDADEGAERGGFESTWDGTVVWRSRDGAILHHEVGVGPGGNYLYLTSLVQTVKGLPFEGDGIELADPTTNEVLWSWSAFDHLDTSHVDPEDILLPGLSLLGLDWTHGNAVVWDAKRSLIWYSVRNFDQFIGIEYPSGAIRVTIGKDGVGPAGLMTHQHAPEIEKDGSILYFDNRPNTSPEYSRVAAFQWNQRDDSITPTYEWRDTPDYFDGVVGDADRQPNGNILITSGTANILPYKTARLMEITAAGELVWDLRVTGGFRLTGFRFYRAERVLPNEIPFGVLPYDGAG